MARVSQPSEQPQGTGPQTDEEWTIHSLNVHGLFFERWCQQQIAQAKGWKVVATNYPVAFTRQDVNQMTESELDIRAELRPGGDHGNRVHLLVEAKKHNPEFVNWIFTPIPGKRPNARIKAWYVENPLIGSGPRWDTYLRPAAVYRDVPYTSDGRETRGSYLGYTRGDKTRTANDSITRAANQVALATQSILEMEWRLGQQRGQQDNLDLYTYQTLLCLPVIITTAQLYTCEFDPTDVQGDTGEISLDKVVLHEQPHMVYEYPLPHHLQHYPFGLQGILKDGALDDLARLPILVVNSRYVAAVLEGLLCQAPDWFGGLYGSFPASPTHRASS